jgi:hypothetical protein
MSPVVGGYIAFVWTIFNIMKEQRILAWPYLLQVPYYDNLMNIDIYIYMYNYEILFLMSV